MTASILDGKTIAIQLQTELAKKIKTWRSAGHPAPCLATILVNDSPASAIYVKNKRLACQDIGIESKKYDLPTDTSQTALLELIHALNQNPQINGILVQLPLPPEMDTQTIIEAINPGKDVDGFHPYNLGRLAQRTPTLRPCTPFGIMQLLAAYQLPIEGQHAVILGASNIVGRPMALEFLMAGATVTVCHRKTRNLESHVKQADILVIATGVRGCVNTNWLQENQIVIDVGMHRLDNGKLCGDLDFEAAKEKVKWLTPVPKGVGPMTITSLLQNTFNAATNTPSIENPNGEARP
ncbi:MAG: bifunctional methylenetetrahydrofolate dehydrogenase/methenyltetrahydrofolate cyclohydrolase FolD [Gammaproteobacteria bacterium]|nr:bifunctional methylenetetrahydrofolate dehydrogenase/methenyltetrahydrofolate cyclohydrolase FolD [Gammaproteobacteria bacterium]